MEMYALGLLRKQKSAGSTASYRWRKETGSQPGSVNITPAGGHGGQEAVWRTSGFAIAR